MESIQHHVSFKVKVNSFKSHRYMIMVLFWINSYRSCINWLTKNYSDLCILISVCLQLSPILNISPCLSINSWRHLYRFHPLVPCPSSPHYHSCPILRKLTTYLNPLSITIFLWTPSLIIWFKTLKFILRMMSIVKTWHFDKTTTWWNSINLKPFFFLFWHFFDQLFDSSVFLSFDQRIFKSRIKLIWPNNLNKFPSELRIVSNRVNNFLNLVPFSSISLLWDWKGDTEDS